EALRAIKVLSFFLLFGAIEFIYFLVGQFKYTSYFLITGIIVIAVIVLVDYLKSIRAYNKIRSETRALEKLAYTDYLTGANNRLSFEQRLEFELAQTNANVVLFYFDVDHLKKINDTFGHTEGDRVIIKSYNIIADVFGANDCFRIGGDEFACVKTNFSDDLIKKTSDDFKRTVDVCKLDESCNISISMGYTTSKESKTIYEIVKVADEQMYIQKRHKRRV
ncbi:MAG TPA: GGDEF domain-containing protein, partial [Acholeplasma sp.]|nr:GGDEF domain-containing protein [Acholeplasma sp.]